MFTNDYLGKDEYIVTQLILSRIKNWFDSILGLLSSCHFGFKNIYS